MTSIGKTLIIRSSPHIASTASVDTIMFNVVLALLPICGYAVYAFGLAALLVLLTATFSCVLTEHLLCKWNGLPSTVRDGSVVITGLLYGLVLPPGLPLWMVAAGGCLAVSLGKFLFGGLGCNPFNPALIGRALLQAAFPLAMTTWPATGGLMSLPASTLTAPFTKPSFDGVSGATPLTAWKFRQIPTDTTDLFFGATAGSTGETCAVLILAGGLYLALRGMMNWRIPVAILLTVAAASQFMHWWDPERYAGPWFMVFSGGLMLGAVFMATDMVASPITHLGCVVYGVVIGSLVVVLRAWSGMPEGVMYAILLGNAVSPLIDRCLQPRVFGSQAPQRMLGSSSSGRPA